MAWKKPWTPSRNIMTPSHSGIINSYPSNKTQTYVGVTGGNELGACIVMGADNNVLRIREQPKPIRWRDDEGVVHSHTPDFWVTTTTGDLILEVKPRRDAEAIFKRTEIVTALYAKRDMVYEVWTEFDIFAEPRYSNSEILTTFDVWVTDDRLPLAIVTAFERFAPRTLKELEEHVAPFLLEGRCDLYHMAVRRRINIDIINQPLGDTSRVSLGPINFQEMV